MEAKDFLGKTVKVGDTVLFIEPGYREFNTGAITKITKRRTTIKFKEKLMGYIRLTDRDHSCIIKLGDKNEKI